MLCDRKKIRERFYVSEKSVFEVNVQKEINLLFMIVKFSVVFYNLEFRSYCEFCIFGVLFVSFEKKGMCRNVLRCEFQNVEFIFYYVYLENL